MTNPYYNESGAPSVLNRGSSSAIRNEFIAVRQGFDTVATAAVPATSTTSLAVGTGSKSFQVQAGKAFVAGQYVLTASAANNANYMHGQVISYVATTLVVNVLDIGGSGTFADWSIAISGPAGADYNSAKDNSGGIPGLTLLKINFMNVLGTIKSFFTNSNTAPRTYTFPDKDITVAGTVDVAAAIAPLAASGANGDINALSALQSINDGQLSGFRNKIINGDVQVSQLYSTGAITPAGTDAWILDQWAALYSQPSKLTFQQVTDAPVGFKYSAKVSVAAQYAPAAADYFLLDLPIEGQNIADLNFGTASAATIAVSLHVKGSVAGTYAIELWNPTYDRCFVGTISVTTSWARQTIVLVGDTTGTWPTSNTLGLTLRIDLGSGSNSNASTTGVWQAMNHSRTAGSVTFVNQVAGSTLNITGVQLEQVAAGATAGTSFEHIPYATQLQWCQRYYESSYPYSVTPGTAGFITEGAVFYAVDTTSAIGNNPFKVTKRATPTMTIYSAAGAVGYARDNTTSGAVAVSPADITDYGFNRVGGTLTAGHQFSAMWTAAARL